MAEATFQKSTAARVLRVDRRRRDPRAVRADVRLPGVQDPDRLDEAEPAGRRSPAGQQVHLRADRVRARARAAADARRSSAATSWCSSFPRSPSATSSSARSACPATPSSSRTRPCSSTARPLTEPYAHYLFPPADETQTDGFDLRRKFGPVTVPDGHYFMMGDNRDDSQDSRFWGFLPQSYVKGRALFIYWSFDMPDDGSARRVRPAVGKAIPPDSLTRLR